MLLPWVITFQNHTFSFDLKAFNLLLQCCLSLWLKFLVKLFLLSITWEPLEILLLYLFVASLGHILLESYPCLWLQGCWPAAAVLLVTLVKGFLWSLLLESHLRYCFYIWFVASLGPNFSVLYPCLWLQGCWLAATALLVKYFNKNE